MSKFYIGDRFDLEIIKLFYHYNLIFISETKYNFQSLTLSNYLNTKNNKLIKI